MKKIIQLGVLFTIAHVGLSVVLFILFGLGLEDPSAGSYLFWYLQQPMLSLLRGDWPAGVQLFLLFVNSAFWGIMLSLILHVSRSLLKKQRR